MSVQIVLADDHRVVRQGLRSLLESEPDLQVIGEASDGLEAVATIRRLRPNVAIVDLMMPSLGGLEITRQVKHELPQTQIVILSMHNNEAYVIQALRSGAKGYVLKESNATELIVAVRRAAIGEHYLSPALPETLLRDAMSQPRNDTVLDLYETLTTRERQILHLAAEGFTAAEIAERLSISPRTVETHRANLMRKLGIHSSSELAQFAIRRGILPL